MKVSGTETEDNQGSLGADTPSTGESHTLDVRAPAFLLRECSTGNAASCSATAVSLSPWTSTVCSGGSPISPVSVPSALARSVTTHLSTGGTLSSPMVGVTTSTLLLSLPHVASPTVTTSVISMPSTTHMPPPRTSCGEFSVYGYGLDLCCVRHTCGRVCPGCSSTPLQQ